MTSWLNLPVWSEGVHYSCRAARLRHWFQIYFKALFLIWYCSQGCYHSNQKGKSLRDAGASQQQWRAQSRFIFQTASFILPPRNAENIAVCNSGSVPLPSKSVVILKIHSRHFTKCTLILQATSMSMHLFWILVNLTLMLSSPGINSQVDQGRFSVLGLYSLPVHE